MRKYQIKSLSSNKRDAVLVLLAPHAIRATARTRKKVLPPASNQTQSDAARSFVLPTELDEIDR